MFYKPNTLYICIAVVACMFLMTKCEEKSIETLGRKSQLYPNQESMVPSDE